MPSDAPAQQPPCFIGCPVWANPEWKGIVFPEKCDRSDFLKFYSQRFNTVEANTTFYGLPKDGGEQWIQKSADVFKFCPKFPRIISHSGSLHLSTPAGDAFVAFLDKLNRANKLGVALLQLPPHFSMSHLPQLSQLANELPEFVKLAVEVRHMDFYDGGEKERNFNSMLAEIGADRIIFDTRFLNLKPPSDPYEKQAQERKPRMPIRKIALGNHPVLRWVGTSDISGAKEPLTEWASIVRQWIHQGRTPYVFIHAAHELYAPELVEIFKKTLHEMS